MAEDDVSRAAQRYSDAHEAYHGMKGRDESGRLLPLKPLSEERERRADELLSAALDLRSATGGSGFVDRYGNLIPPTKVDEVVSDAARQVKITREANERAAEADWRDPRLP